ncbi:signaling protein [Clostridium zeae]|uniref:Signaling protein n=1 Tax=Clostridium zeae TaxID=2759022 RepID=A0ABQ1EED5_9CLOT|nr:EAL domain-containing protein [Clostridium zeae]GFZ33014.1 signaling protein [Clostridium zeae]
MKLSNKVFMIVCLGFISLIAILYIFSKNNLLEQYNDIEILRVEDNVKKVVKYINRDIENINSVVLDYSLWDDTYNFMNDHNEEYIDSNFRDLTIFNRLKISFLMFIDKNGKIIYSENVNEEDSFNNLQKDEAEELAAQVSVLSKLKDKKEVKGIIQLKNKTLIVSANNIRKSDGTGDSRGIYVNVRFLDKIELDELNTNLGFKVESLPYSYSEISSSDRNVDDVYVKIQNRDVISGYGVIKDLFGKSVILLKLDSDRVGLKEALKNVNYFITVLILTVFIFYGAVILLINLLVVRRIIDINNTINKVETEEDLSVNLSVAGFDEIAELSVNFNKMFKRLKKSRDEIIESERKYHLLFSNMAESFAYNKIVTDKDGRPIDFTILEVNDVFLKVANIEHEAIINKQITELIPSLKTKNKEVIDTFARIALSGTSERLEEVFIDEFNSWYSIIAYGTESGYFAFILSDITEKKKAQEKILRLAYKDDLTGFPNRKGIIESIKRAMKEKQRIFAILFIDLDDFKSINDSLGHIAGDFVLMQVSSRLNTLKNENITIGRLGGDEFIILQENIETIAEAESLAESIKHIFRQGFMYRGNELHVQASIGISMYPNDGTKVAALMKSSDIAMYAAKKNGGHGYKIYSNNMNGTALEELMLENYLRKALELEQFILYLQPIGDIQTMKITNVEALIRWNHQGKILPPSTFLLLAKKIGKMVSIDNWVLRKGCKYCKKLHEDGLENVSISINTSFKQLSQDNFVEKVIFALEDAKLDPSYLSLEITEDEAMEDVEFTIDILKRLKELGIRISLDDFGTGYSSLSYVNKLPIDTLKIDKSLIEFVDKDQRNAEIIKSIIIMSHSLNIKVVAEGIETEEQLNMLRDLNCDYVQGYYLGRPMDYENFIENNK